MLVARQVIGVVTTEVPGPTPANRRARVMAEVPELTTATFGFRMNSPNFFSKFCETIPSPTYPHARIGPRCSRTSGAM